eukprot:m51a1_g7989 putative serine threonine-protein phosphatase 5 (484) ;mRNA; r:95775-97710
MVNGSKAEQLKEEGNKLFQAGHYEAAIAKYTAAIGEDGSNAVYYANRANAHIRAEEFGSAIEDATRAIEIDPRYPKGYHRRATAHIALLKWKDATRDLRVVVQLAPNDRDSAAKLRECEKKLREMAFAAAISRSVSVTEASDSVLASLADLVVPSDYTGATVASTEGPTQAEVETIVDELRQQKRIHAKYVYMVLLAVIKALRAEPNVVEVDVPAGSRITVCGDVHGQFYDLLHVWDINGRPSVENPYLFNGDFVDRGSFSFETVFALLAYKALYPRSVHLARGNHETRNMNQLYGFEGEIRQKYSEKMYELFCELFCELPLAHVLAGRVFVVHGGLSAGTDNGAVTIAKINAVDRRRQPSDEGGIMSDLLWADPQPQPGTSPSKRGVGLNFGPDYTERFLEANNLKLVVRSHEVKDKGHEVQHDGKCITVFSAPNYCDRIGNQGSFIRFVAPEMKPEIVTFDSVPHPNVPAMAYAPSAIFGL